MTLQNKLRRECEDYSIEKEAGIKEYLYNLAGKTSKKIILPAKNLKHTKFLSVADKLKSTNKYHGRGLDFSDRYKRKGLDFSGRYKHRRGGLNFSE